MKITAEYTSHRATRPLRVNENYSKTRVIVFLGHYQLVKIIGIHTSFRVARPLTVPETHVPA